MSRYLDLINDLARAESTPAPPRAQTVATRPAAPKASLDPSPWRFPALPACLATPDPLAEAAALVRQGYRCELNSAVLGARFVLVRDDAAAAREHARCVTLSIYTLAEIAALAGSAPDDLRLAHAVKAQFDATARGTGRG